MAEHQVELMKDVDDDNVNMTAGTAESENTSNEEIVTRYIEVPEKNIKAFTGRDNIMDLQIASGAMIQVTEHVHEDPEAKYRPVRLIGCLENVDKAEKLIKAVVNLAEAGGTALLHKDDNDSDGLNDDQEQEQEQQFCDNALYAQPPSRAFRKRFCSRKRPLVPLPSKHSGPVPFPTAPLAPSGSIPFPPPGAPQSIPGRPSHNQSSDYAASQAYATPQPPPQQPIGYGYGYGYGYGMLQPPYSHSSGYGASQAYVMPQPPAYQQAFGYAASQPYIMPQPPANNSQSSGYSASQAYIMPQPPAPAYNQSSGYGTSHVYGIPQPLPYYQASGYAAGQAYAMPQPPLHNQATGYAYSTSQPQPPPLS